jgi:hypothetical protein
MTSRFNRAANWLSLFFFPVVNAFAFIAVFSATDAYSDELKLTMTANPVIVRPGDPFELEITVEASGMKSLPEPGLPQSPGLEITGKSVSQQVKIVNLSMIVSKTVAYSARIQKEGVYTIPPVTVESGGTKFSSGSVKITVDKSAPPYGGSATAGRDPFDLNRFMDRGFFPGRSKNLEKDDLFVTMETDKTKTAPYEQVVATFSFYRSVELWEQPTYVKPDFKGFWVEELSYSPTRKEFVERITIKDKTYTVTRVKYALIPIKPGTTLIDPARVYVSPDPWSDRISLSTQPINLETSAFPEKGKPKSFLEMTGRYDVSAGVEPATAPVNGGMTFNVTITGDGYLKSAATPPKPDIPGFEVFDPKITDTMDKTQNGIVSKRVIEYPLIPKEAGEKVIPPMAIAWFDPAKKEYVEKQTSALNVKITPASAQGGTVTVSRGEVKQSGAGIRFIKPDIGELQDFGAPLYRKAWAPLLLIPPFLLVAISYALARRRKRLVSDPAYARAVNASKNARMRLVEAERISDTRQFYSLVDQAVRGYLADKWDMSAPSMTPDIVREKMAADPKSSGLMNSVIELMDRLTAARFSPVSTADDRSACLGKARDIVTAMEKMR